MGFVSPESPEIQQIQDGWLLCFDNREDLTKQERELLKENNIKCRGKNAWPNIRRYELISSDIWPSILSSAFNVVFFEKFSLLFC